MLNLRNYLLKLLNYLLKILFENKIGLKKLNETLNNLYEKYLNVKNWIQIPNIVNIFLVYDLIITFVTIAF